MGREGKEKEKEGKEGKKEGKEKEVTPMSRQLNIQINNFTTKLRRREVLGAHPVALETAYLMRNTVSQSRWTSPDHLREIIKQVAKSLISANPLELSIGNIVRRILFIIREESAALDAKKPKERIRSLSEMFGASSNTKENEGNATFDLKGSIIESINQIIDELETIHSSIAVQALEHIHSNEVILVYGWSKTVFEFLKYAGRKRKFQVVISEAAPSFDGQQLAVAFSQAKTLVDVTLITDSAIFAMMARVNKVLLACHAVLANGGLLAKSGSFNVAAAAKQHSVPVVVLTGLFKLSPVHAFDQDTYNTLASPNRILEYGDADFNNVDVVDPVYDYIPPEFVSLFVTNQIVDQTNVGGVAPTYLYRLLSECYHQDDYEL